MPFISACACAIVTPSFKRAITGMELQSCVICSGLKRKRHPQLRVESIVRARLKNADDGVRLAVHANRFADQIAIGVEVIAPQSMTEYDDVVVARLAFFGQEVATEEQRQSFHREETGSAA